MKIYRQVKCSDRLPSVEGEYYCVIASGKCGNYCFDGNKFESSLVVEWLEEVELPSVGDIYSESFKSDKTPKDFIKGANFIINKLKNV